MNNTPISRNDSPANSEVLRKAALGILYAGGGPQKMPSVTGLTLLHHSYLENNQKLAYETSFALLRMSMQAIRLPKN